MINSIKLGNALPNIETYGSRACKRSALLIDKTFHFQPGLNLLVGLNGSGKSSLLQTLAQRLMCFNFGLPKLDDDLYRLNDDLWQKDEDAYWRTPKFMPWVELDCAAIPYAMYSSPDFTPRGQPNRAYSLCYGLGKDATDFYDKTDTFSSGEGMANVLRSMFEAVRTGTLPVDRTAVEDTAWRSDGCSMKTKVGILDKLLPVADAPVLLLLDEPERALDLNSQLLFWKDLVQLSEMPNVQIIIATHSVIPLFMQNIKYSVTEMTTDYLADLQCGVQTLQS